MTIHASGQRGLRLAGLLCAALFLTLAVTSHASAATCRVTTAGTNGGSGAWASPMNLQTALTTGTCTEVWVAAGVYKPGSTTIAVFDSFNILPGVAVYGGFSGTETSLDARNPTTNVTILSGDIDNNDVNTDGNNIAETSFDIVGYNSYHVVSMNGSLGTPITASTVLDGFTITGGQANDPTFPENAGGGFYCNGENSGSDCSPTVSNIIFSGNSATVRGGAMYNRGDSGGSSSPVLSNVTFSGNSSNSGGAMYNDASGDDSSSSPTLSNVTFSSNIAYPYGGAMYNFGANGGTSSPALNNVIFIANRAFEGGAMYSFGLTGISSPALRNVTFSGNSADGFGGAMTNYSDAGGTSSPTLSNVTFSGNDGVTGGSAMFNISANVGSITSPSVSNATFSGNGGSGEFSGGGAMYNLARDKGTTRTSVSNVTFSGNSAQRGGAIYNHAIDTSISTATLSNVILWGDTATRFGPEIHNYQGFKSTATATIDHSVVQGSGGSASWDTGLGSDGGGNIDADPLLGSLGMHGGLTATLLPGTGSTAIDAGNATTCSDPNTVNGLDQRGITRPQGAACDIGAVEIEISDVIFADGFEAIP